MKITGIKDLPGARLAAQRSVDQAAMALHDKLRSGPVHVIVARLLEAQDFLRAYPTEAHSAPVQQTDWPMLAAYRAKGVSLWATAQEIVAEERTWRAAAARVERVRQDALMAIATGQTEDSIRAAGRPTWPPAEDGAT